MWTLSGFIDEISEDFAQQCAVAASLGLRDVELRKAWGINILDLDDDQLDRVRQLLADHGLAVSSIGSPIGKIFIDEDFEAHLGRMRQAVEVAAFFSAPYIRLFSFFIRPGTDPDDHRHEVLHRMASRCRAAAPRRPLPRSGPAPGRNYSSLRGRPSPTS